MNRIKGKVEAYVVSTMEDNQRISLLDNLAICAEKVEEEAEELVDGAVGKHIKDCHTVLDFCDCLHVVFSHELRIVSTKQKPSFWNVAEKVSPKDAVQMIYRLPIRQSDSARCQVWIRYALKEGTIGSFMSVLSEDTRLLKEFYKPAAFVRDSEKLSSATSLILNMMSSVQFDITLENFRGNTDTSQVTPELPQQISYRSGSQSSADIPHNWRRRRKSRGISANIVNIEDSQPNNNFHQENSDIKSCTQATVSEETMLSEPENESICSRIDEDATDFNAESLNYREGKDKITSVETLDISNEFVDRTSQIVCDDKNATAAQVHNKNDKSLLEESCTAKSSLLENSESCLCTSESSHANNELQMTPALKISGSLNHSETSAFKIVLHSPAVSYNASINPTEPTSDHEEWKENFNNIDYDKNKLNKIINVITLDKNSKGDVIVSDNSSNEDTILSDKSIKADVFTSDKSCKEDIIESYKSSKEDEGFDSYNDYVSPGGTSLDKDMAAYDKESFLASPTQVKSSEQLENVLNLTRNEMASSSTKRKISTEQYYVPGIHTTADVCFDTPPSINMIPKQQSEPIDSPASLSFDKTVFHRSYSSFPKSSSFTSKSAKSFDVNHFYSDSESDTWSTSDQSFSILADLGITDDFIGLKENHFSSPESFMGFSSFEELENAIATCKDLIKQTSDKSQRQKDLVAQLVQLRLKLHELKENSKTGTPKGVKMVLGHQFYKQAKVTSTVDCDACGGTIFPLLQSVHMCNDCGFHCHRKCLNNLDKACVQNRKLTKGSYNLEICPEVGLPLQQFRCSDCHQRFNIQDGNIDMRLCDYSGLMYCLQCHWNEGMVIPARVIHNWDFTLCKVSRQSKHVLQILNRKPEINLQVLNPALFNFVDELRDVRTLREQILSMKAYLSSCRVAIEQRLLLNLQGRQHFVDNSQMYSLQDLVDIQNGVLLGELARRYNEFAQHIKVDCLICQGKGFFCEICRENDVIFPFDNHATTCTKCRSSFHRSCFTKRNCPKCERSARRASTKLIPESEHSS